ncbi:glycosyltransferase family 2 protein [Candidatus Chloroploca sp. M-50]|uniref:Glycosyltransferase family 2 protein n=1 Tax=Candidatus Chloroploca mongolica TaxID=2528176 RepID=A0ABS4D5N9_9CHLR|nr:glycosyltransferase family 2 protein [Candidatus Chloroploca mongolica]MBP1464756.1 glycosyltransferase family 2 protein [Candidatus Chloroploca mongolica]
MANKTATVNETVTRRPTSPGPEVPLAFAPIPTDDPEAALHFCRTLAALTGANNSSIGLAQTSILAPQLPPRRPPTVELSLVIPAFNEAQNLPTLYQRIIAALDPLGLSYEIIFVNDGSRDQTLALLQEMARQDERVLVVDLARNFGHQVAISAGMDYSHGQAVAIMDADLQDPPEILPAFIAKWREGYEVVYAIREQRKECMLKQLAYLSFYRILKRIAQIDIPLDAGDFCVMDRRVVDILNGMPERNRFVRGIRSWVGFRQTGLAYERHARYAGKPKYTISKLIYLALDGLVSFSYIPLRMISIAGLIVSLLSILIAIGYAIQRLTIGLSPPGFATLVVAVFFFAGIQLITIGVIGEYVGRIFEEVKHRPLYVVRQIYRNYAYSHAQ